MKESMMSQLGGYESIREVARKIAALLDVRTVYLYNHRLNSRGDFTSFKLAVVADFADKAEAERRVYREVDSELPFDALLYTPSEWESLSCQKTAFARHISDTGHIVYEQA